MKLHLLALATSGDVPHFSSPWCETSAAKRNKSNVGAWQLSNYNIKLYETKKQSFICISYLCTHVKAKEHPA